MKHSAALPAEKKDFSVIELAIKMTPAQMNINTMITVWPSDLWDVSLKLVTVSLIRILKYTL